ncbi:MULTISPECIES: hypothetical protein [Halanaerobium]|jgi:hypothetical protein|uniref:Uncharacterized protein n=1 Tax=Halanaerobium kushneri TaxID=56779 RepID=A0A1N6Q747_9FIRM|nr:MULTISPECIES: hypothetical protein [Halanaerobium]PUU88478.1 MAG: hypothetical protein CI947_1926 [Halanaerobium sp.]RCW61189.1 hypothetical protein DFR80_10486 [Halanaerobium sp. ST460_2HS_T2]SIQ12286.1 hypothetical protein SAMN05421834_101345 [Halanaerobium kushneri]
MRKKLLVVGLVLLFSILLNSAVYAQIGGFYGLDSILMSDWQLDYIKPLDPGDLKKGEYRFSPIIGRIKTGRNEYDFTTSTEDYNYDNTTTAYILVFDTALSDNLSLHSKYAYQPWETYTYDDYRNIDESRGSLLDLFINYEFKEDKTMFFGYNRSLSNDRDYNNSDELIDETESLNNIYYLGFEIRGSFANEKE